MTEDQTREAINAIRKGMAAQAQDSLDALEVLDPIFEEALECASHPDDLLARAINLREFFRSMEEQEDQEDG